MPAAIAIPAIAAVGSSVVGGVVQSRSQGKAMDAQERANREATAYAREQDKKREEWYRQQYQAWQARQKLLMQRFGLSLPEQAPGGPMPGGMPGTAQPRGMSMADMMAMKGGNWGNMIAGAGRGIGAGLSDYYANKAAP